MADLKLFEEMKKYFANYCSNYGNDLNNAYIFSGCMRSHLYW